jgi:hypothetical protein
MLSLLSMGCSPGLRPMLGQVNPLVGKTTDWRAACGRSACPVRREGEPGPLGSSYPYKSKTNQRLLIPPSTRSSLPTVNADSSGVRKTMALAISLGFPKRPAVTWP